MWEVQGLAAECTIYDLEDVKAALAAYDRVRPRLSKEYRDVGRLWDTNDLLVAASSWQGEERRLLSQAEKARAQSESDVLFMEGVWRLVRVRTEFAAIWWGRGTKWCTAARWGNQFNRYHTSGELLVVLTPSGRYQLAKGTGEFRDASDRIADLEKALASAPITLRKIMGMADR
jgi:hypothetical protein